LDKWKIQIYRGILTGLNEAFVINEAKRDEIIKRDPKSAELIRPILRGKDIRRYTYKNPHLFLICTFPSKNIDINNYSVIREELLSFGKEKLEQSGKTYLINGAIVHSRKKTNNDWFETQDSINYWDDFYKPKILFQEMVQSPCFTYDEKDHFLCLDTARIITGDKLKFLLAILNSKLFFYAVGRFYGGGLLGNRGVRMKHTFFLHFPCIIPSEIEEKRIDEKIDLLLSSYGGNIEISKEIDNWIFDKYFLSKEERQLIEDYCKW
jgi:hypothetical protein